MQRAAQSADRIPTGL